MPTLARRQDGVHIIRHHYREFATWQLSASGLRVLERRGVVEDGHFSTDLFMHLWMNGEVFTGIRETGAPGPVVIGDRSAPMSLREAIQDFHTSLWRGDTKDAWRFGATPGAIEVIRAIVPSAVDADYVARLVDEARFREFSEALAHSGLLFAQSWRLLDIVEDLASLRYCVFVGVQPKGTSGASEVAEEWRQGSEGWRLDWKQLKAG